MFSDSSISQTALKTVTGGVSAVPIGLALVLNVLIKYAPSAIVAILESAQNVPENMRTAFLIECFQPFLNGPSGLRAAFDSDLSP